MVTTGDVAINPALFKDVPYDVDRDLAPISRRQRCADGARDQCAIVPTKRSPT